MEWTFVKTLKQLDLAISVLSEEEVIAYDIETTSLGVNPDDGLLMIGVACKSHVFVFPYEYTWVEPSFKYEVTRMLGDIFSRANVTLIAHYSKFDNRWLRSRGLVPNITFDTHLASYVLQNNQPHGLKKLAKKYLDAPDYEEGVEFTEGFDSEKLAEYCAWDCYYTLRLYYYFIKEFERYPAQYRLFTLILMKAETVLQNIENRGIYIDQEQLKTMTDLYEAFQDVVEINLKEELPEGFKDINWNSPKQVGKLLYDHLGLPVTRRTPKGEPSTGRSALLRIADKHKIPALMVEYRKYNKALVGFLEPWHKFLEASGDSRLHTTYNIARTSTGRLSAENPNLQQTTRGVDIRSLVTAPPGHVLLAADYSQIELRCAAFIADATSMKRVYLDGGDIHTLTASRVLHKSMGAITKDERFKAKAINFGFLYGMWWKSFVEYAFDSYGIVMTEDEAAHAREVYFQLYPELERYHERQRQYVRKNACVVSPLGRVRYLPEIRYRDKDASGKAERQAINTPVQGMASDITLLAMILTEHFLKTEGKHYTSMKVSRLVGQIHDALLVECPIEMVEDVSRIVTYQMEKQVPLVLSRKFGVDLDIPLEAEIECGAWGSGVSVEKFLEST